MFCCSITTDEHVLKETMHQGIPQKDPLIEYDEIKLI